MNAAELRRGKANDRTMVVHLVRDKDPKRIALCGRVGCFTSPIGRPDEHGESDCPRCTDALYGLAA